MVIWIKNEVKTSPSFPFSSSSLSHRAGLLLLFFHGLCVFVPLCALFFFLISSPLCHRAGLLPLFFDVFVSSCELFPSLFLRASVRENLKKFILFFPKKRSKTRSSCSKGVVSVRCLASIRSMASVDAYNLTF